MAQASTTTQSIYMELAQHMAQASTTSWSIWIEGVNIYFTQENNLENNLEKSTKTTVKKMRKSPESHILKANGTRS